MPTERVGYPEKESRYVTREGLRQQHEFLAGHTRKRIVLEHVVSEHPKYCLSADRSREVGRPSSISMSAADDVRHPAIDVWSAGIIFLFFLTRKFPLFQSNDDVEALMELSTVIGRKGMERTATLHSAYNEFLRVLNIHTLR